MRSFFLSCLCVLTLAPFVSAQVPGPGVVRAFTDAARAARAAVCQSQPHYILMVEAQKQAQLQASLDVQGHQQWSRRYQHLQQRFGFEYTFNEICAETWGRQANLPPRLLCDEFFFCWRQSEGHWRIASWRHTFYGCGMAQGLSGRWYGCIIVADRK